MCGIFGIVLKDISFVKPKDLKRYADILFILSESRGKEASGIALRKEKEVLVYKSPIPANRLIKTPEYSSLFNVDESWSYKSLIGHSRLATNGSVNAANNNQPVVGQGGVVIHNGIITNDSYLWHKVLGTKPTGEVDTEVIPALFDYFLQGGMSCEDSMSKVYSLIEGAASIAFYPSRNNSLILGTNTGSLYMADIKNVGLAFGSERYIIETFLKKAQLSGKVSHLSPGYGLSVDFKPFVITKFRLKMGRKVKKTLNANNSVVFTVNEVSQLPSISKKEDIFTNNDLKKIERHSFDYVKIKNLRRCTKCILPETMPYILFDKNGICNYCNNHQKINYKGKSELVSVLKKYKSKDGKPDCILALSGGRDSTYGLHYLKRELGLNPIAYTYDWGMCTDIARRNQYRITGKLGIEHIIVSANIPQKREYIRKNILAWLKKPDLGMVPLFMEGDKQNEFYVNQLARRMGIKLIVYCRGNELENEEFKWGYCGIKNATPGGVIHNLSFTGKVKLLTYWGWHYLTNPSYINSSLLDTLFGFFSTYVAKHDYLYLWHYIPWNEKKIVGTLRNEYGWELNPETRSTWRIDDGTPAFYNYIFYSMQGFTENDTFRSNQIREGIIDRKKAFKLTQVENKPRYNSLKWYFDSVGIDGDMALTVVDKYAKFSKK